MSGESNKLIKTWHHHSGTLLDSVKGFDVIECVSCGYKHIVPIPDQKEMAEYYKEKFVGKRPKLIERIKEDYQWWEMVYKEKYDYFEDYLKKGERRLIDIGCGLGYFLKVGKERGWDVVGAEPSRQSVKHATSLGLDVINATIYDDDIKCLNGFNVVHMHEVLEHLPDPIGAIDICSQLLSSKGLLCIIVPNDFNILQEKIKENNGSNAWWISPPEHINYFDISSIENLLNKRGFKTLHKITTFPMEFFLLMGQNYIGDDPLGRKCHSQRKNFELNLSMFGLEKLKESFYKAFADSGIGREVMIIARKES